MSRTLGEMTEDELLAQIERSTEPQRTVLLAELTRRSNVALAGLASSVKELAREANKGAARTRRHNVVIAVSSVALALFAAAQVAVAVLGYLSATKAGC